MGREHFSRTATGMTESEAYHNALNDAERENGHQEGYSGDMNSACDGDMKTVCIKKPKPAKRCNVEKTVQKGTRKWETIYVVSNWRSGDNYIVITSQGDAIKKAKEMALKTGGRVDITIQKQLVGGADKIAVVSPMKAEQGVWRFSGTARC